MRDRKGKGRMKAEAVCGGYAGQKGKRAVNATCYGYLPESVTLRIREPGSALTHLAGLVASLAGTAPLILKARLYGSPVTVLAMTVFMVSMILLYAASTAFHTVVLSERKTEIFRKMDHASIGILIAGSYTAVCLTALRGRMGTILLAAVWALAAASVLFKLLWVSCPKWISSAIYSGMGWLCMFALPGILRALPVKGFLLLLCGGILYTAGGLLYALRLQAFDKRHPRFGSHEIFHLFILAGSLCHYLLAGLYLVHFG